MAASFSYTMFSLRFLNCDKCSWSNAAKDRSIHFVDIFFLPMDPVHLDSEQIHHLRIVHSGLQQKLLSQFAPAPIHPAPKDFCIIVGTRNKTFRELLNFSFSIAKVVFILSISKFLCSSSSLTRFFNACNSNTAESICSHMASWNTFFDSTLSTYPSISIAVIWYGAKFLLEPYKWRHASQSTIAISWNELQSRLNDSFSKFREKLPPTPS